MVEVNKMTLRLLSFEHFGDDVFDIVDEGYHLIGELISSDFSDVSDDYDISTISDFNVFSTSDGRVEMLLPDEGFKVGSLYKVEVIFVYGELSSKGCFNIIKLED